MIRLLCDESVSGTLLNAIERQIPELDIIRLRELNLLGEDDPVILAIAAELERAVLASDVQTMINFAYDRVRENLPMPGLIIVQQGAIRRDVLESLEMLAFAGNMDELRDQVTYLPL